MSLLPVPVVYLLFAEYAKSGFLTLQLAIDRSIIQQHLSRGTTNLSAGDVNVDIRRELPLYLRRFPYPPYEEDTFLVMLSAYFAYFVMLTFLFTAPCIVKDVVLEKQRKLKVNKP